MTDVSDLKYRLATLADVGPVHQLIELAYRGDETAGRWDSESHILKGPRTTSEHVSACIEAADSRFVLAEQADQLLGCALIQRTAPDAPDDAGNGGDAYFGMFAISPRTRGEGLGKMVLAECERRARDLWKPPGLQLTVISLRTELIAWYERQGYALTGGRVPFPFSETTGEVRRDFDMVVMRKGF